MAIKIGANLSYNGKLPNFDRDSFETKAAMKAFDENSIDEGHLSYCEEDGNIYQYNHTNTVDTTTGRWRIFKTDIVQQMGDSTTSVMSQKSVTDAIQAEIDRATAAEQAIIFDVSAYNNGAVFESLQALLSSSNLSTLIPTSVRHGGMSIRFIQGSTPNSNNKYVQYLLKKDSFSVNDSDWLNVTYPNSENVVYENSNVNNELKKIKKIHTYETSSIIEDIRLETESGVTICEINENGANFLDIKKNGNEVVTKNQIPIIEQSISSNPSDTNIPTSKAVVDYVTEQLPTKETTTIFEENVIFCNNDETDVYVEITSNGIKAKNYYDSNGNIIQQLNRDNIIIVAKNGGDYTTISSAVSHANDTENKAITILIYPGVYTEEINALSHKNLSFVGINRETCIIKATDGRYGHDPLSYQGIGLIANLTIISTHDDYEYNPETVENIKNYCIHVDNQASSARLNGTLTIQNCYLYCEQGSALGMGSRANFHVKVIGCDIRVNVPSWNVRKAYGGIYMHSYDAENIEGQELTLINNVVRTNTNTGITVAKGQSYRSPIKCYMYNNISYSYVNGHTASFDGTLDISSYGNSANTLNHLNS